MQNSEHENKILCVLRGPVGIGKSTYIKNKGFKVLSTDDFFYDDKGNYNFDLDLLPIAHCWNYTRVLNSFSRNEQKICIDNTNIELWEMKDYVAAARHFNYEIKIKEFDIPEGITALHLSQRSKHNVPEGVVEKMILVYSNLRNATIDQILKSEKPKGKY